MAASGQHLLSDLFYLMKTVFKHYRFKKKEGIGVSNSFLVETSLPASLFPQEETLSLVVHVVDGCLFTSESGVLNWWRCAASLWIYTGNRGQMFFPFLPESLQSRDPAKNTLLFPEVYIRCCSKHCIQGDSSSMGHSSSPTFSKGFQKKKALILFHLCDRDHCAPAELSQRKCGWAFWTTLSPCSSTMPMSHIWLYFHAALQTFKKHVILK